MKGSAVPAAVAMFLCAASTASAADGWQDVRWGMSAQEVSSVYGAKLAPYTDEDSRAGCGGIGRPVATMRHQVGYMTMGATFCFDPSGGLCEVMLRKNDAQGAIDIFDGLVDRYGRPDGATEDAGRSNISWTSGATLITFASDGSSILVDYKAK